jgi:hypothetical protein
MHGPQGRGNGRPAPLNEAGRAYRTWLAFNGHLLTRALWKAR